MKRCIISLTLLATSFLSVADEPSAKDFAGRLDVSVPQSAGFAILGVSPEKVIDPQSGKELGAALLQGLDANGNFQSGFALETRPFLWNQPDYIEEPTAKDRALSGIKLSLAATTGLSTQDQATRYGLGVNWSYQFNDPLFSKAYVERFRGQVFDLRFLRIPLTVV